MLQFTLTLLFSSCIGRPSIGENLRENLQGNLRKVREVCYFGPDDNAPLNIQNNWGDLPEEETSTDYGRKFFIQTPAARIPIIHLWGTPTQMGFAHGQLMKSEIRQFIDSISTYLTQEFQDMVTIHMPQIPDNIREVVANEMRDETIAYIMSNTERYTHSRFYEELTGMHEATGVDLQQLREMHVWTEVSHGHGSTIGAWDEALRNGSGLVHARTVDWDMSGPFRNYPQITVYHPNDGHHFISVGWTGFIGVFTGINDHGLSISANNVQLPDSSFHPSGDSKRGSKEGEPFVYLMRDIMQFNRSFDDAAERIKSAHRTVDLVVGLADGDLKKFNSIQYSNEVANFMDDQTLLPGEPIKNIVYHGLDWDCPSYNHKLWEELLWEKGNLNPEKVKTTILPKTQTGSTQSIIFNIPEQKMFVAFARPNKGYPESEAYSQAYYDLSVPDLLNVPMP